MMGGATEDDEAMRWFLQRANGGDILVLRASGSDGYNNYMYSGLGININSVETIVFNNVSAANDSYIHQKIMQAEAIWFAGGDQWNYVHYWRNTPIDSLINSGLQNRQLVIGGTSAGMAILGGFYFSAQNGTVTSATALANPYASNVTVDSAKFLQNEWLQDVITDTHYDDPDRKGRHVTFMARIFEDYGIVGKGIACDEYTAVCIDTNGLAKVFGGFPTYDDNAYFIQPNCELPDFSPENCTTGNALNWNRNGIALKVYQIKGTSSGSKTFDLSDWKTGQGGTWQDWCVDNGVFYENAGSPINCLPTYASDAAATKINVFPNPFSESIFIQSSAEIQTIQIIAATGIVIQKMDITNAKDVQFELSNLSSGIYLLIIETETGKTWRRIQKLD